MNRALLGVVALFVVAGPVLADDVITLDLETPGFSSSKPEQETRETKPNVTTVTTQTTNKSVYKVAMVSVDKANIHANQKSGSRVYSICLKDTPLAVVTTSGSWYGVLMIDGSTGWIHSSKVKVLDYTAAIPDRHANARRGNYSYRGSSEQRDGGSALIQTALQYLGVPYVYGGTSPDSGIDCSAFVRMIFGQYGVTLPRVARDQANVGTPISGDDVRPGDRLYFACKHSYVDHCGIYMGNGYFIHASASRGGVGVDKLSGNLFANSLVAVMR